MTNYDEFLDSKRQLDWNDGFDPLWLPDSLFDFQLSLTEWAIRKGRAALFADCGMGKTLMQLVWAENIVPIRCERSPPAWLLAKPRDAEQDR